MEACAGSADIGSGGEQLARIGAAIGWEFSYALLAALAHKPEVEVRSACLITTAYCSDKAFRLTPRLFKHALVQDAAYGTLLRDPRRSLHVKLCTSNASSLLSFT
jgi:predicted ATPase